MPHNDCDDDDEMLWPQELITFFCHLLLIFRNSIIGTSTCWRPPAGKQICREHWSAPQNDHEPPMLPHGKKRLTVSWDALGPARFEFTGESPTHDHRND